MKNNHNRPAKTSTAGESIPAAVLSRVGRSTLRVIGKNPHQMSAARVRREGLVPTVAGLSATAAAIVTLGPAALKNVEKVMDKQINVGEQQAQANIDASHSPAAKAMIAAHPNQVIGGESKGSEEQTVELSPIAGQGIGAVTEVVNQSGGHVSRPDAIIHADGSATDIREMSNFDLQAVSAGLQVSDKLVFRLPPQVGEQAAEKIAEQSAHAPQQQ